MELEHSRIDWALLPDDILYGILHHIQFSSRVQELTKVRAVCKAWKSACCTFDASIDASIKRDNFEGLCRSFPSAWRFALQPTGRYSLPQRLPDMSVLANCTGLSELRLRGFRYPQPKDASFMKLLPLEVLVIEESQPAAVAMPFLLELVHALPTLKHLAISPPSEQRAGKCNHLFEHVCLRLPELRTLRLGSAAFNQQLDCECPRLEHLTSLELLDCGIIAPWLSDILRHLPVLGKLIILRPRHPCDWPYDRPCGELCFAAASPSLRVLRVEEAAIAGLNHLQLQELDFSPPRNVNNHESITSKAVKIIAMQNSLEKLRLKGWDKVYDAKLLETTHIKVLHLVDCTFDAHYELVGGVTWQNVEHLHTEDDVQPLDSDHLAADFRFLQLLQHFPALKSVSGDGWLVRRILEIQAKLRNANGSPLACHALARHLDGVEFS